LALRHEPAACGALIPSRLRGKCLYERLLNCISCPTPPQRTE